MKKRKCALLLLVMLCGCGDSGLRVHTMNSEAATVQELQAENKEGITVQDSTAEKDIVVYVCGAVAEEGVYTLPYGSRAADALEAAGGYSDNAVPGMVNLAKTLEDGEQLRFPAAGEEAVYQQTGSEGQQGNGKVNINTADRATLMTLPGIGESRAEDIISHREKNGPFEKPEDIMKVSGIKDAVWQKIKDRIAVR